MHEVVSGSENHPHTVITDDQGISEHGEAEDGTSPTDQEETIKITPEGGKTDDGPMSILVATVESEATSPSRPSDEDAASTHSLPVAHVAETPSTQPRPSTAHLDSSGSPGLASPTVPRGQQYSTVENTATSGERPNRYRTNLEVLAQAYLIQNIMPYSSHFASPVHLTDFQVSSQISSIGEMQFLPLIPEMVCAKKEHRPQLRSTLHLFPRLDHRLQFQTGQQHPRRHYPHPHSRSSVFLSP